MADATGPCADCERAPCACPPGVPADVLVGKLLRAARRLVYVEERLALRTPATELAEACARVTAALRQAGLPGEAQGLEDAARRGVESLRYAAAAAASRRQRRAPPEDRLLQHLLALEEAAKGLLSAQPLVREAAARAHTASMFVEDAKAHLRTILRALPPSTDRTVPAGSETP